MYYQKLIKNRSVKEMLILQTFLTLLRLCINFKIQILKT
jgi:hypothetical protein